MNRSKTKTTTAGHDGLTATQEQAVVLLAQGKAPAEVAEELTIDPSTLRTWHHEAAFEAALNRQHDDLLRTNTRRLRALMGRAVGTLETLLEDENTPPNVRLNVALQVLKLSRLDKHARTDLGPATAAEVETARTQAAAHEALFAELLRS